jgi:hypothetical protein
VRDYLLFCLGILGLGSEAQLLLEDSYWHFMVFLSLEGLQLGFDDAFFMICK